MGKIAQFPEGKLGVQTGNEWRSTLALPVTVQKLLRKYSQSLFKMLQERQPKGEIAIFVD